MEISVLILSCVILGLNLVLPVLLYFIFLISRFVTLYGFYQIKYIHTYIFGLGLSFTWPQRIHPPFDDFETILRNPIVLVRQ